ncbi:cb3ba11b-506d-45aa-9e63-7c7903804476 [Sclerotinia trifoliorum]|uniref:Cb3ba11b-506d-45aa-9e63-7c7903804476 n=1 Tax=Sclerotinia trifoliorum TaxID=28548 RepID=A0A8H2ZKN8_9HELO|nr:cb3ba11b-506d-45aa-9e63-7c7903804476 [Sclerotinia trifoliorum]
MARYQMAFNLRKYRAIAIFILVLLSIRINKSSLRNFLTVAIGAGIAWTATPSHSRSGVMISRALIVLAIAMSPVPSVLQFTARQIIQKSLSKSKPKNGQNRSNTSAIEDIPAPSNPDPIKILHNPANATVDIIAVHGLGSSVETTWTHKGTKKLWLRDFLHLDFPTARIMTYRHNSKWMGGATAKDLTGYGKQFLSAVQDSREGSEDRPIIIIAHSFGGLLIEQALVTAKRPIVDARFKEKNRRLVSSLAGIIFLGTPHAGSGYSRLGQLYCLFHYWNGSSPVLLNYMDPGSEETRKLEDEFSNGYDHVRSIDFHEDVPNVILWFRVNLVVNQENATRVGRRSLPLDTDHYGLNKYENREDASYKAVKSEIIEMIKARIENDKKEEIKIDDKYQALLESIGNHRHNFKSVRENRRSALTPGTCQWILEQQEFLRWSENTVSKVMWVLGKPGSGKSFISEYLCDYYQRQKNIVMYFLFDKKNEAKESQSLDKFYTTVLHQLLESISQTQPKLATDCLEMARKQMKHKDSDSDEPFKTSIEMILAKLPSSAYLIIDALDECIGNTTDALMKWISYLESLPNLRLFITSRSLDYIEELTCQKDGPSYILRLSSVIHQSKKDIRLYINQRIKKPGHKFPDNMSAVVKELEAKCNGMILYARLMLDILEKVPGNENLLLEELKKLPNDLAELYSNLLKEIKSPDLAVKTFRWLVTCKTPPTSDALHGVYKLSGGPENNISRDRFRSFLIEKCSPLIEILENDTVRLVHTTVSEFLKGDSIEESRTKCPDLFLVRPGEGHQFVALICVKCLQLNQQDTQLSQNLYEYSVREWETHSKLGEVQIVDCSTDKEVLISFCTGPRFHAWLDARGQLDGRFKMYFALGHQRIYPTALHIVILFDLWFLGEHFLCQDILHQKMLNARDATESTPLHLAASQGHPRIVRALLKAGARTDIKDMNDSLPLHRAVRRGNSETLIELVGRYNEVDLQARDKYKLTPLHIACQLGWDKCAEILINCGASVSDDTHAVESPIAFAIANGHLPVVQVLLKHDPSLIKECGKPLIQAARKGANDIVEFLCDNKVDMSYKDGLGQTALHKACISGDLTMVKKLLSLSVPVDPLDNSERAPLYFAAEKGFLEIVDVLIKAKADVNNLDRRRETALFKPAGNGHFDVVARLLDANTDATILDLWNRTPLRFAARKGHIEIVKMLLERTKIDQEFPDWVGRTTLHNAAASLREGQESVIDLLIEHGANPKAIVTSDGGSALHAAILREKGQPPATAALIDRLIKNKVPLEIVDKRGYTALFLAVNINVEAGKLLLEAGAPLDCESLHATIQTGNVDLLEECLKLDSCPKLSGRDSWGMTALHLAAILGRDNIVKKLLEAGAPTRCWDMNNMDPLMCAQQYNHISTVSLLQNAQLLPMGDYQSRVEQGIWGRTALHWAAEAGEDLGTYIMDESLSHIIDDLDDLHCTALHLAVLSGSLKTVQQLLSAHAQTGLADTLGKTPQHYATKQPDVNILKAIISAKADIDVKDDWSRTPLHLAVEEGHAALVEELMRAGAKLSEDNAKNNPLHIAITSGKDEIVRIILNSKCGKAAVLQRDGDDRTVLHLASQFGRSNILTDIFDCVPEPASIIDCKDSEEKTALHLSALYGHPEITRKLIDRGAIVYKVDKDRFMPVHFAARAGHEEIVKDLINALPRHVDWYLQKSDQSPPATELDAVYYEQAFWEALYHTQAVTLNREKNCWEMSEEKLTPESRETLRNGIISELNIFDKNDNSIPSTILMQAVEGRHEKMVRLILQMIPEMPIQARSYHYSNVLSLAARNGDTKIVSQLIEHKADPNAITDMQDTCLHEAAKNGHDEVIKQLVVEGANADLARLHDGYTPLHLAAENGHTKAVEVLLHVAYLNVRNDLGRTPLHCACLKGHENVINSLLDANADVSVRDYEMRTPLEIAIEVGISDEVREKIQSRAILQKVQV